MGATKNKNARMKKVVNSNLITLKIITFLVFGGLACIHTVNNLHPRLLGLNFDEYRLISIVVPLISIIGPLIAGPLADKLASKNANTFGRSIRSLTAIFLILAAIFYGCTLFIPSVQRFEARRPLVSFGCDSDGAIIFQERCTEERTCFHWKKEKFGSLILTNCSYTCQNPSQFENLYNPWTKGAPSPSPLPTEISSETVTDYEADYEGGTTHKPNNYGVRRKRDTKGGIKNLTQAPQVYVEPPHLCLKKWDPESKTEKVNLCHVYTADTESLTVQATLGSATNKENDTHSADWCTYPLDGFQCNVPKLQAEYMARIMNNSDCKPMVECEVENPYDSSSVLAESQCIKMIGDIDTTYYGYIVLRIIAEIFPLGALTLLNTAIMIATRETSTGRGEVCRQYFWGILAWILIIPHLDFHNYILPISNDVPSNITNMNFEVDLLSYPLPYIITAMILFILAAIVLLFAKDMPLSPPEWWWHTKTGVLVYPMSAIRKYGPEIFALSTVALVFGIFWSIINSFILETYFDYHYGITYLAIIPIFALLFNVDKFIEYSGHSNIFIGAFSIYIIRFTSLAMVNDGDWLIITFQTLEPLVIAITWIAIILYMRHIVPRRFTATGQALAVIVHFCLGKSFGAIIGLNLNERRPYNMHSIFHDLAITSCVIALIYFIIYHLILAPKYAAKSQPPPPMTNVEQQQQQSNNGTSTNGANGNYTPLRVYHNERGKKGQFRY